MKRVRIANFLTSAVFDGERPVVTYPNLYVAEMLLTIGQAGTVMEFSADPQYRDGDGYITAVDVRLDSGVVWTYNTAHLIPLD
jgi:hypothetical protein